MPTDFANLFLFGQSPELITARGMYSFMDNAASSQAQQTALNTGVAVNKIITEAPAQLSESQKAVHAQLLRLQELSVDQVQKNKDRKDPHQGLI